METNLDELKTRVQRVINNAVLTHIHGRPEQQGMCDTDAGGADHCHGIETRRTNAAVSDGVFTDTLNLLQQMYMDVSNAMDRVGVADIVETFRLKCTDDPRRADLLAEIIRVTTVPGHLVELEDGSFLAKGLFATKETENYYVFPKEKLEDLRARRLHFKRAPLYVIPAMYDFLTGEITVTGARETF